eukprot:GHVS01105207.1.p1 GENE.GHVS01105207.1~~GHVS01105207.1.p1  ORF type:complete len:240 (-),score=30.97 GHVS01105207.1:1697-2416(-)
MSGIKPTAFISTSSYVFCLTYISYASLYLTRKPFSVVKSQIETDVFLSPQQLGLIDTAFLVLYALGQFLSGPLGDKAGPRDLLTGSFVGSAFACCCFVAASTATSSSSAALLMCMAWGLNGLVQSCGFPLMVKTLTAWIPANQRGEKLGIWSTCQQVGGVMATAAAGYLATQYGWRMAFIVPACWVAFFGLVLYLTLVEEPPSAPPPPLSPNGHQRSCCWKRSIESAVGTAVLLAATLA